MWSWWGGVGLTLVGYNCNEIFQASTWVETLLRWGEITPFTRPIGEPHGGVSNVNQRGTVRGFSDEEGRRKTMVTSRILMKGAASERGTGGRA